MVNDAISALLVPGTMHEATFLVNAVMVSSQWQHRVLTFSVHPPVNAEYELG